MWRWVALVIDVLERSEGPVRHSVIARRVPGITQRMLTQTLRTLERDGLVHREVSDDVPARTSYALTETGLRLTRALQPLRRWVTDHAGTVAEARLRHDARTTEGAPTIPEINARRGRSVA